MNLSDINERIDRIKSRIAKEYAFDDAGSVVVEMENDLVWSIEVIAHLEARLLAIATAAEEYRVWTREESGQQFGCDEFWAFEAAIKEVGHLLPDEGVAITETFAQTKRWLAFTNPDEEVAR